MTANEMMDDQDEALPEAHDRSLTDAELADLTESEDSPVAVTFSTQDFDVSGLVKRLDRDSMIVPSFGTDDARVDTAGFQRGFVWNKAQMDRFIESLLLGYPVPGIFLVKQSQDNRMLVLDGQQRLVTLQRFYRGIHNGKEFSLQNVGADFKGSTYRSLEESLQFKLDDSYMQATIVAADGSEEVNDAIYQIFERLNSGGTQLTPHEIRVALYAGDLVAYLENLNNGIAWRTLFGKKSARMRDHELILRIVALFIDGDTYARPLKIFLNTFAAKHRTMDQTVRDAGTLFIAACEKLHQGPGAAAFRRTKATQVNVAQAEAVTIGVMRALAIDRLAPDLEVRLASLLSDEDFTAATTRATADRESVVDRLRLASSAFAR